MRSFIAIEIPSELKEMILEQRRSVERQIPADQIRWLRLDAIHLTLKFLGEIDEKQRESVRRTLSVIGARIQAFEVMVGGFGCFPNCKRPRVLWVGLSDETGALAGMHKILNQECAKLGFEIETRAFQPHLTLGRVSKRLRSDDLRALSEILSDVQWENIGCLPVRDVCLYRSVLRPSGAEYSNLMRCRLKESL
jgi:2'-5' RNA ligase